MTKAPEKDVLIRSTEFAAIDPLALLFRSDIYARIIVDWKYPHVPKVEEIREVARNLTITEREATLARARKMLEYARVVEEALR